MTNEYFVNRWATYFYLQVFVNAQNNRTWAVENSFVNALVQFEVWCELISLFIVRLLFFKDIRPEESVIYIVHGKRYESLFRNQVIPTIQRHACLGRIIFMQNLTPLNFANTLMQLISWHFRNDLKTRLMKHSHVS